MKMKELEPFFQLSKLRCAAASDPHPHLLHYGASSLLVTLYFSITNKHGQIILADLVSLVLTTSVTLLPKYSTLGQKGVHQGEDCKPDFAIRPVLAKLEEGLIGAVFCLVFILVLLYWDERSTHGAKPPASLE